VRVKACGFAIALTVPLAAGAIGLAQVSAQGLAQVPPPPPIAAPPPGFVPPFEIMRTVRAAGMDPLAPPLREGTTYVLRATDYRGILMRVVVDANTGTIRAVNRIVPGPTMPGQIGMMAPPYGAPPRGALPPYGPPPEFDSSPLPPNGQASLPPPPFAPRAPAARDGAHSNSPPLPRPRPATVASRKAAEDANHAVAPSAVPNVAASTAQNADKQTDAKSSVTTVMPAPVVTPAPAAAPVPVKSAKAPPSPPIND
jgi:hypothetical protein